MARPNLDDRLAALRQIRGRALVAEQIAALRKAIGDRSNLIVAAAAEIAGENAWIELSGELEAAFKHFRAG